MMHGVYLCINHSGSEWNNVVLYQEDRVFGNDAQKWLYTGITRAKKKLVII